jgi:hypothetical protein
MGEDEVDGLPGLVAGSSDESDSEGVPRAPLDEDAEVLSFSLIRLTGSKLDVRIKIFCSDGPIRLQIDRSSHGHFVSFWRFQIIFVFELRNNTKVEKDSEAKSSTGT